MLTGSSGEKRPVSEVEEATKVGRISTKLEREDPELRLESASAGPSERRRVLLRDWKRK